MKILENLKSITVKSNLNISSAMKKITQHECRVLLVINKKKKFMVICKKEILKELF